MTEPLADKFLYERVARVESRTYFCRLWIDEIVPSDVEQLRLLVEGVLMVLEQYYPPSSVAVKDALYGICKEEGVNSVEIVLRSNGAGMCVHKNWP